MADHVVARVELVEAVLDLVVVVGIQDPEAVDEEDVVAVEGEAEEEELQEGEGAEEEEENSNSNLDVILLLHHKINCLSTACFSQLQNLMQGRPPYCRLHNVSLFTGSAPQDVL